MRGTYTLQDMIENMLKTVDLANSNRGQSDVARANRCVGIVSGMVNACRFIGLDYDFATWQDGEFERIGLVRVDGVEVVKNDKIDWKAYADAVLGEAHHWCDTVITTAERK